MNGSAFNNGLSVTSTGSVTLQGNNTYTGLTTMNAAAGSLTLSGDNTAATGGVTLTNGTLNVNSTTALGTGTVILTAGTINNTSGSAVTNTKNNAVTLGGNLTFGTSASTATNNLNLGTGTVTTIAGRTVTFAGTGTTLAMGAVTNTATTGQTFTSTGAGNTLQLAGLTISSASTAAVNDTLAGTGNITITGPVVNGSAFTNGMIVNMTGTGVATFSGTNTYTGSTAITGGTLNLDGSLGSTNMIPDGSAVTLSNGTTLKLSGSIANEVIASLAVSAGSNANILLSGANEKLTITSNTVTLGSGASLNFNTVAGGANATGSTLGTGIVAWNPTLNAAGIINPGITVTDAGGTGFATTSSGNVVRLAVSTLLPASGAVSPNHYLVDNNTGGSSASGSNTLTLSANESAATITVDASVRSGVLDLNGKVLSADAWLFNGSNAETITGSGSAGLKSSTSGSSIVINNSDTAGVTINAPILANGASGLTINNGSSAISTTFSGPSGASTYTGNTLVNNGTVVVTTDNALSASSAVVLSNASTNNANLDLSTVNQSIAGLTASPNNAAADLVSVGTGKTLTVTGALLVGVDTGVNSTTKLTMNGGGSLIVAPSTLQNVSVGLAQGGSGGWTNASTLDVSALSSVTLGTTIAPINELRLGYGQTTSGNLILSNTANSITATTLQIGNSNGANSNLTCVLTLGTGTNSISADTINIGVSKSAGSAIQFASQTTGSPGSVTIGGKSTAKANLVISDNLGISTGAFASGTLDLRGHDSTLTAGSVKLGVANNTGVGGAAGTINFDTGTFTADSLNVGSKAGTGGSGPGSGTLNLSGGSFTINSGGSVTLATNTAATGTATGLINLTGGTFTTNADILKGGGTGTTATITLNGSSATLDMKGKNIGSAAQTITLNLQQGTLKDVSEINGGGASGAITKTTSGALTLLGTNTYTGDTTVSAGTLQVGAANAGSTGTSAITVNGAGTVLAGTGTINGVTTVTQGTVKPGDSAGAGAGTLTVNNSLTVASTGAINLDISTALNDFAGLQNAITNNTMASWAAGHQSESAATGNDKLVVSGALSLSGPIVVGSTTSATFGYGDYFNLMDWASLTGSFSVGGTTQGAGPTFGDLTLPGLSSGYLWDVSQFTATGVVVVVPEPSRALLLFVGFTLALLRRRRA